MRREEVGQWDMGMDQYLLIPFLGEWTSINPSYFEVFIRGTRFWHTATWCFRVGHCEWRQKANLSRKDAGVDGSGQSDDALQNTDCPDWPGKNKKWNPARALGGESCLVDTFRADVNAMLVTPWCWEMASVLYSCYSQFQCQYSNKSTSTEDSASNECGRITEKVQLHIDSKPFLAVSANWSPSTSELCDCRIFHWTADDHFHIARQVLASVSPFFRSVELGWRSLNRGCAFLLKEKCRLN